MDKYTLKNFYTQGKFKIDIPICNYCNLNCSACMFGTNTKELPKQEYDLAQFKKDIDHLSQFKDIIDEVNFLGGEPTLNKNLLEYIKIVKEKISPKSLIIITNGISLVNNLCLLNKLKELGVILSINHYPEVITKICNLEQKLKLLGIAYFYAESSHGPQFKSKWSAPLTSTTPINTSNLEQFRFKCRYGCLLIWNGYFMACGIQFSIPMRNKLFGTNYKEEMEIPIESIKTKEDLIEMQGSKYIPEICKYCQPGTNIIKWIPHTVNKIRKEDYIF